jgi:tyrosyl-tRNA synthetase
MDVEERLRLVLRNTQEVLVEAEVRSLLERASHPRAYIGYEPSGLFQVGALVTVAKVKDLAAAGFDVTVFLADWHAMINDKLGGSLDSIRAAGSLYEPVFRALGVGGGVRFRWASDLVQVPGYWARVLRCAKATSLARAKRAMTIMGRKEEESEVDSAKLFYPSMQVADIFELPVDLAYAGMDQRRAHVLAREVAHHYNWPVPVAVHTPLISSLKGGGRMNPDDSGMIERKMSKSDPTSSIVVPASAETIDLRIREAFCPAKEVEGNPVLELARWVLLPWEGKLDIDRPAKFGGPLHIAKESELLEWWTGGKLHPQDLKTTVAAGLKRILAPANRLFEEHPDLLPHHRA